jgi:hypothetical protein
MRKRPVLAGLVTLAMLFGGAIATGPAASAGIADIACTGTQVSTFSPALTSTVQNVTTTQNTALSNCLGLSQQGITAGLVTTSGSSAMACKTLLQSQAVTFNVTWNTGQTSTISGSTIYALAGPALVGTFNGTIQSGAFAGDTVVVTNTAPSLPYLMCVLGLGNVPSINSNVVFAATGLVSL